MSREGQPGCRSLGISYVILSNRLRKITSELPRETGYYLLVLHAIEPVSIQVGRLGTLNVVPGYYYYAGSAFGPGGLHARVSRHIRKQKSNHWHIDYLREVCEFEAVFISIDEHNLEHQWATHLAGLSGFEAPMQKFGASDCKCYSHLVYAATVSPQAVDLNETVLLSGDLM